MSDDLVKRLPDRNPVHLHRARSLPASTSTKIKIALANYDRKRTTKDKITIKPTPWEKEKINGY
jgi:hypothetical protein